jgi:hypothetical protein
LGKLQPKTKSKIENEFFAADMRYLIRILKHTATAPLRRSLKHGLVAIL